MVDHRIVDIGEQTCSEVTGPPKDENADDPGRLKYVACIHGEVQGVVSLQMLERGILVTN